MNEIDAFEATITVGRTGRGQLTKSFDLPPATDVSGTVRWKPTPGLSSAQVTIDGRRVAGSAALLSAGRARVTLKARSRIEVTLRGARGASFAVRVRAPAVVTPAVFTGAALYQGGRAVLNVRFPAMIFRKGMTLTAVAGPGLQGLNQVPGEPIPVQRINRDTGSLSVRIAADAALAPVAIEIRDPARTLATGTVTVRNPLPIGNGLLEIATVVDAATAALSNPQALARDESGALWIADTGNHVIKRLDPDGTVTTAAGDGTPGNLDGPATTARLREPGGIAVTSDGKRLYVADTGNHSIRVLENGTLITLAGAAGEGFADGTAEMARFRSPRGSVLTPDGILFLADTGNHAIRRIEPDGRVTTVVGNGEPGDADGLASEARLNSPVGLALGPDGTLYVSDGHRVRAFGTDGTLRTVAGAPTPGYRADAGAGARFSNPRGLAWSGERLVVADTGNCLLREVWPDRGLVLTLAGGGSSPGSVAGDQAQLDIPTGIVAGEDEQFVFCDTGTNEVRELRRARSLAVQLLNPPIVNIVTGDSFVVLRARTNRPGAVMQVAVLPASSLNQNLQASTGPTGDLILPIYLTLNVVNQITLTIRYSRPQDDDTADSVEEASRIVRIRSQLGLDRLRFNQPKDSQRIEAEDLEAQVAVAPDLANESKAIVISTAGVLVAMDTSDGVARASLSTAKVDLLPGMKDYELLAFPLEAIAVPAVEEDSGVLASTAPILVRTPRSLPALAFANLQDDQIVGSNRIDVAVASDRTIVDGDVNGTPISFDGVAKSVPLTAESTRLTARIRDLRGQMVERTITVRLAQGVVPKRLLPEPLGAAVAAPGETFTVTGPGLGLVAQTLRVSTTSGYVDVPVTALGPDGVLATLPLEAINGAVVLQGGEDMETLPLNLRLPAAIRGDAGALLRDQVPNVGEPYESAAYVAGEQPLRVEWRRGTAVGAVNDVIARYRLRLVGTEVLPPDSPLWDVTLWMGVPLVQLAATLAYLRQHSQVAYVTTQVRAPALTPNTISVPTTTPNFDWDWKLARTDSELSNSPTWQLQFPRFPAVWNIKAKAKRQIDAMIYDNSKSAKHEDVDLGPGAFGTPSAKKPYHGIRVASVYGANHNGSSPNSAVGLDGANPLKDKMARPVPCQIFPVSANLPWAAKDPKDSIIKFVEAEQSKYVRVINASIGLDFAKKGFWYFNANLARPDDCISNDPDKPSLIENSVGVLLQDPICSAILPFYNRDVNALKKQAADILVMRRMNRNNGQWGNVNEFFDDLLEALAPLTLDEQQSKMEDSAKKILLAKNKNEIAQPLKERLMGYVVASYDANDRDKCHVAELPQESTFFKNLITVLIRYFINSTLPRVMLSRGIVWVNGAGNIENEMERTPGAITAANAGGQINTFWWGFAKSPWAVYNSEPGYFTLVAANPNLLAKDKDALMELESAIVGKSQLRVKDAKDLVINVGAIEINQLDNQARLAPFSFRSQSPDDNLYAPGVSIQVASIGEADGSSTYDIINGTSVAAPLVSGLVAFLLAVEPIDPETPEERRSQIVRLRKALSKASRKLGPYPALDAYLAARRFLSTADLDKDKTPNYDGVKKALDRYFDQIICDVDDGTIHGNDTENPRVEAAKKDRSGQDVEWLPGDDTIDMADFRSLRDAYVQIHFAEFDAKESDKKKKRRETLGRYALRLRDLNASGARPWDDNAPFVDVNIWPRFDFDGSGKLEKVQLEPEAVDADVTDVTKELKAGSDLGLLASFWPKDADVGADHEFVKKGQLLSLLLSCDLRIPSDALLGLKSKAREKASGAIITDIQFLVEGGEFDKKKFKAKRELHSRKVAGEEVVEAWFSEIQQTGRELNFTAPLVPVAKPQDLDKEAKAISFDKCYRLKAILSLKGGTRPALELVARMPKEIAFDQDDKAAEKGCFVGKFGGRYPVLEFVLETDNGGQGGKQASVEIKQSAVRGVDKMRTATLETTLCVDCQSTVIAFPEPPVGDYHPVGGIGPLGPGVGGGGSGGGGGASASFGGVGFGAAWGVSLGSTSGSILCYATLVSLFRYLDSDFAIDAIFSAPSGTGLGNVLAELIPGEGLTVVGTPDTTPAAAIAAAEADGDFAAQRTLRFVVRGTSEGTKSFTIKVQGRIRPEGDSGPGEDWGPMDIEGTVVIIPAFFLVGLTFSSDYLEEDVPFDMLATVTNSPQATGTAFDTVMAVSGEGAEVQGNPVRELGDLAPGTTAVADFTLTSRRTGPIVGTSQRTTGRVAVDVNVGAGAGVPAAYPIQGSRGLSYLQARYPELTKAILALAGGAYADGLAQNTAGEIRAAVAVALAMHRAGFRLLAGDDAATVIGELILATQGGASADPDFDRFRRMSLTGRRVREAAGPALVQAAGESQLAAPPALFRRLAEILASDPGVLWTANGAAVRLEMADADGQRLGAPGPAGETRDLPFAEQYAEDWPPGPVPLAVLTRPPVAGELMVVLADSDPATVDLSAAVPASAGGMLLAIWMAVSMPAGGRARLPFIGMPSETPDLILYVEGPQGTAPVAPTSVLQLADPAPRVLAAGVVPSRKGGAPLRNVEVRFSESVDADLARDPAHYRIPGRQVLNASWYAPTRSAYLFVDPPLVGSATLRVEGISDRAGQPIVPADVPIAGVGRAGTVQGRVLGPDAQPLPEARVELSGRGYLLTGQADVEGAFRFGNVPLGDFTLVGIDPASGRSGSIGQRLSVEGQEVAVVVTLVGDGSVAGQLRRPDGAPAAEISIEVIGSYPFDAFTHTDRDGFFRVDRVPLAPFSLTARDSDGRTASARGTLAAFGDIATFSLILTEAPVVPAQLRVQVSTARGGPLAGAVVRLEGRAYIAQATSAADGIFDFGVIPAGDYIVSTQDSAGRRAEQAVSVKSGTIAVNLRFQSTGIVSARALRADGKVAAGARTAVLAAGFYTEQTSDANGLAQFSAVPAGSVQVLAQLETEFGTETVTLPESRELEAVVRMVPQGILLPVTLLDANAVTWVTRPEGTIAFGVEGTGLGRLRINGVPFPGAEEGSVLTPGLEVGIAGAGIAGVDVQRRIYVSPETSFFVRVIDTLANPGSAPVTVAVELEADLPGYTAQAVQAPGRAVYARPGALSVGLVWSGADRPSPSVGLADGRAVARFAPLTLAPGTQVALLHFAAGRPRAEDVAVATEVLAVPPPEVLETIDPATAARLINFTLPEASGGRSLSHPLMAFGRLETHAFTADGFVIGQAPTAISVHSPLYDRRTGGVGDPSGTVVVERLPVGDVTVEIRHPLTGATGKAAGRLERGGDVLVIDAHLTDSGTVEGVVRRSDGSGVPQCDVYINGIRVGTSLNGRFRLRGVPLGRVQMRAVERQSQLAGSASGVLAEVGRSVSIDIAFPPTGTVTGRVLSADLTALANLPVTLGITHPDNVGVRTADTDAQGRFFFPGVPAGAVTLSAQDPDTGAAATGRAQVVHDGESVTVDLVLSVVGIVTGRVSGWDGLMPLAGAQVEVTASDGQRFGAMADQLGRYAVVGVARGPFRVTARPAQGTGRGTAIDAIPADGSRSVANVRVDTLPPTIRVLAPADGSVIDDLMATLRLALADAESGLDPASRVVILNGENVTSRFLSAPDGTSEATVSVGDGLRLGDNRLTVRVADQAGNIASQDTNFRVAAAIVTLSLRGRTGAPDRGASIDVYDRLGARRLTAGPEGQAEIRVPPGAVAFEIVQGEATPEQGGACATIAQASDGESRPLDLTLLPSGRAIVQALGRDGVTALRGAPLTLLDASGASLITRPADDLGWITFSAVPVGPFRIRVVLGTDAGETLATLGRAGDTLELVAVLGGAGAVAGVVETPTGRPVPGATVTLEPNRRPLSTTTAEDGTFRFENLAPNLRFQLTAQEPAGGLSATAGGSVPEGGSTAQVRLVLPPAGWVRGQVLGFDKRPLASAMVALTMPDPRLLGVPRTTISSADGQFELPSVRVGFFTVTATTSEGDFGRASGMVQEADEVVAVTVTLAGLASLIVTVVDGGGQPVSGALVTVSQVNDRPLMATTDANGAAAFARALAGRVGVSARDLATGLEASAAVEIQAAVAAVVTLRLPAVGTIAGRVLQPDGLTPAPGVAVRISGFGGALGPVVSEADGTYRLGNVRVSPSPYTVEAYLEGRLRAITELRLERHGQEVREDITLSGLAAVSGRVVLPDGATPAAGARIVLFSGVNGRAYYATADAAGAYRFANLPVWESPFRAEVDLDNRRRAQVADIRLERHGQDVTQDITLIGLGTVSGRALDSDGIAAPGTRLELTSDAPVGGGRFLATSGADGRYIVTGVPVGTFRLHALDPVRGLVAELTGRVGADGEQVMLDVRFQDLVQLPYVLYDANRFEYVIASDGTSVVQFEGSSPPEASISAPRLTVTRDGQDTEFRGDERGMLSAGGRQVTLVQSGLAGLEVSRRVFVMAEGEAARHVEFLANPGAATVIVDVTMRFLGSDLQVLATSTGRDLPVAGGTDPDRWAVLSARSSSGRHYYSAVWDGPSAGSGASEIIFAQDRGELAIRRAGITVPSGGQVALLHFLVQETDPAAARAGAERLMNLPPEVRAALTEEEQAAVVNWTLRPVAAGGGV